MTDTLFAGAPKRLAIVSSYNEECGAAFYSSRLKIHLEAAGHSVTIKRLPVSLLRVHTPRSIRLKGDAEIRRIAGELGEFDAVLLQFEPGLYGTRRRTSYRRVRTLLQGCRNAVLTVHGFDRVTQGGGLLAALDALVDRDLRRAFSNVTFGALVDDINIFWNYVRKSAHVKVLTFCRGDQVLLERFYGLTRISNYPITYFSREQAEAVAASVDREALLKRFGLDPRRKYFAVYGFLNAYKGHLTAMKALEYLPEDWHLAIIGGEHPQGLHADRDIGPYVRQLLAFGLTHGDQQPTTLLPPEGASAGLQAANFEKQQIKTELFRYSEFKHFLPERDLRHRVHFLGQVSDDDMPRFYYGMDYAVHPYMKTKSGQSGSGPATMALEFGARSLFSNAPVFREMGQYFDGAMSYFNIGNFVELADALQRHKQVEHELTAARETALTRYNPAGMVAAYMDIIDG